MAHPPPSKVHHVFLSSTQVDPLAREFREAALNLIQDDFPLRYYALDFKRQDPRFNPTNVEPLEVCRRAVLSCHIYIGIFGFLYGTPTPDGKRSYTELEFDTAFEAKRPMAIYILPEGFPSGVDPKTQVDQGVFLGLQQKFRHRVQSSGLTAKFVDNRDDFLKSLRSYLSNLEVFDETIVPEPPQPQKPSFFVGDHTHLSFDRRPIGYSLDDLDGELLRAFFLQPMAQRNLRKSGKTFADRKDQMEDFGLLKDDRPTMGSFLCFAPKNLLVDKFSSCSLHTVIYDNNDRSIAKTQLDESHDNLVNLMESGMRFLTTEAGLQRPGSPGSINRDDLEIPEIALREALANALVHRDYEDAKDQPTRIEVYPDRVEITSYGGLTKGITEDLLNTDTKHLSPVRRNDNIARVFMIMQNIELGGTGISRMRNLSREAGIPVPTIVENRNGPSVTVIFRRPPKIVESPDLFMSHKIVGPLDLFISHATSDDEVVNRIYKTITDSGLTAWVDHLYGVTYGGDWSRKIHDATNACRYGLFIMSPASVKSEYCEAEWNRIQGLGKRLYIAQIADIPLVDVPLRLGIVQSTNLATDFDDNLAALITEIKRQRDINTPAPTITRPGSLTGPFPYLQLELPMIGRDEDYKIVAKILKTHRAAQILGLGGIGKTRLLAEFASNGGYADGVIWHDMAKYPALEQLSALIRDHLGLPPTSDEDKTWEALNQHAVLLALDNGETAANPAAYATRINQLDPNGGTRVLLASRLRWDDLRNAPQRDLRAPSPVAAIKILEAMAEAEPLAHPPGDQAEAMAEAARYHPELMWFAVRWLDDFPPNRVLAMLRDLKGTHTEDVLEELIGRTVKQLQTDPTGEAALAALRKLAVCKGGFTFEAAEAMGAASGLKPLRQWGLIRLENERYEIDPLVIAAVGIDESARRVHYDYYLVLARQHDAKQDYLGLDVESANLEAAFEWAIAANDFEAAYWLANACMDFLANRGRFDQRMIWFKRLEAGLEDVPASLLKGALYNSLGVVYQEHPMGNHMENLRRAIVAFETALVYWTPQTAPLSYASTQNNLGVAYRDLAGIEDRAGNLHHAIVAFETALVYWTPQAAPLSYASTQNNLGTAYRVLAEIQDRRENLRRAITAFETALVYWTPQAAPLSYASTQNNLGTAYRSLSEREDRTGNLRRAIAAYEVALVYRTPASAPLDYATTQANLGLVHWDLGNISAACASWREAEDYFRQMDATENAGLMRQWIADAGCGDNT